VDSDEMVTELSQPQFEWRNELRYFQGRNDANKAIDEFWNVQMCCGGFRALVMLVLVS
jgi:hypothetical protein